MCAMPLDFKTLCSLSGPTYAPALDKLRYVFSNICFFLFMLKCCDKMSDKMNPQVSYTVVVNICLDKCSLSCKNGFFLITRYLYYTIVLFQLYHDT